MSAPTTMIKGIGIVLVMALESMRFVVNEIRSGHIGTRGYFGHQFFANELLADKYKGFRKQAIASYVLFAALRNDDEQALRIVLYVLRGEDARFAVSKLRSSSLLTKLLEWSTLNHRTDIAALADSRLRDVSGASQ